MQNIELSLDFYAKLSQFGEFGFGSIYYVKRTTCGGFYSKPVAKFFITQADIPPEGVFPHRTLDCFISEKTIVSTPEKLVQWLFDALKVRGAIDEPAWIGWHVANELGGKPLGEVFDFD